MAAACIALLRVQLALYLTFSFGVELAYNWHSPAANGRQGPIPQGMSQTLLTSKKQGNLY
jgi:hypothetical protein